ncbi:MAG TPA: class I SAM-dependent methyltransferase [Ktedonobacterales bacterium]|nr:class I SAM-dependent methyltransferase [Ktedonobacterales bacterium]
MPTTSHDDLLQQQIAYYRARAGEYDEWFLRQGRYDRGAELNQRWFDEIAVAVRALEAFQPTGDVLELAAGTGIWTQHLVRTATRVTCVDSSPEVLALNRERLAGANVRYLQADLFAWQPDRQYDAAFFSFWLSHVPPERFAPFWEMVRAALTSSGRVFFVDALYDGTSTARDHQLEGAQATTLTRRLNDGREYRIVKVFHEPYDLQRRLSALGWDMTVTPTERYFYYGVGASAQLARQDLFVPGRI